MKNFDLKSEHSNKKLYEFLATSYDISSLAGKIEADRKASMSVFNLKKMVNHSETAKSAKVSA